MPLDMIPGGPPPGENMSHRTHLSATEQLRVMRHLLDVVALRHDPPRQRQVLIDGLNAIVGTNQAFFFVCDDWEDAPERRPRFVHQTLTQDRDPFFLKYMAEFGIKFPLRADAFCDASVQSADARQFYTFDMVVPDLETQRRFPAFMDIKHSGRISDGAVSLVRQPTDPSRIAGFGMHQFGNAGRLTPRQKSLIAFATEEVQRLIELGHLVLPPTAEGRLSDRLQQILDRLLTGHAPKSIARELGLSVHTVRDYVKKLYRDFEVSGREELMAKFIK
jgi:DNA-binding CsgD family transcriptional regulator